MLTVYIGWDSREPIAADVCKYSILEHASIPVDIVMLKQNDLRKKGMYWREVDKLASTEFTFTRFLVPELNNFKGTAIFMDSDMVLTTDIAELISEVDPTKAVSCVQHNFIKDLSGTKMLDQQNVMYPRKNWSSLMLFNNAHPDCANLTPETVNTKSGQWLHRLQWTTEVGKIPHTYNWCEGSCD